MLPDGTQLILNTNTKVSVHYTAQQRLLQLDSGEINISVAKDPRPAPQRHGRRPNRAGHRHRI